MQRPRPPRTQRLVRSELGSGYVVSTVCVPGGGYETALFSPGWPERGDSLELRQAETRGAALEQHLELLRRWAAQPPPSGWQLRLAARGA